MAGIYCISLSIAPLAFSSCDSWLDVVPDDRISETVVFDDQLGYQKLLNGLYSGMTSTSLYGRNLSAGAVDVLAQYYNTSNHSGVYYELAKYDYATTDSKSLISDIWGNAYQIISNANTLIDATEHADCPLIDRQKKRMKGEALAVRAFIHFDLLRLFGPVPTNLSEQAIPYQTSTELTVQPFETGTQILTKIKADLTEAIGLLKETEPLIIPDKYESSDLESRPYRMNYYAVKAVLARAYLWEGNKTEAYNTAVEVINDGSADFPFVTEEEATGANPDRLFTSEVLFGLYNTSRDRDLYNALFSSALQQYARLFPAGSLASGRLQEWYDDQNDYRYRIWAVDQENLYHQKYRTLDTDTRVNYTVPLVRMGEMYLIAAECATDVETAATWLNTLRNHHNCFSATVDADNLASYILREYRKELLGEGQLFYYMKRNAMELIPDGNKESGNKAIELSSYVLPLPDGETSMREGLDK